MAQVVRYPATRERADKPLVAPAVCVADTLAIPEPAIAIVIDASCPRPARTADVMTLNVRPPACLDVTDDALDLERVSPPAQASVVLVTQALPDLSSWTVGDVACTPWRSRLADMLRIAMTTPPDVVLPAVVPAVVWFRTSGD